MKRITKKTLALTLALVFVFIMVMELGLSVGITHASAGVKDELWLKEDYPYMLLRGERHPINENIPSAAPYFVDYSESRVAYIPLSAIVAYMGGSYELSGNDITLKLASGDEAQFNTDTASWRKNSVSMGLMKLPPVIKEGEAYLEADAIRNVYGTDILNRYYNYDIGVIIFSTMDMTSYDSSHTSLKTQIAEIDALLFDLPTSEELYSDITSNITNLNTHPRLLVNQARFDEIRAAYVKEAPLTEDEAAYKSYIARMVGMANNYFLTTFTETEDGGAAWKDEASKSYYRQPYYLYDKDGNRLLSLDSSNNLVGEKTYTNPDTGETVKIGEYWQTVGENGGYSWSQSSPNAEGYDLGGRSNLDGVSRYLKYFAFAWQITGEDKWVDAFVMVAEELGKWEHWGEGHFLDCADGAVEFALGYDWIYPALSDTEEGRATLRKMAETLFVLGVEVGYNGMNNNKTYTPTLTSHTNKNLDNRVGKGMLHNSVIMGSNWKFQWDNNWMTVCTSGMIISALALVEYDDMREVCLDTVSELLSRINLCLFQYAPDGSYIESAGYWEYSTRTFMLTIAALDGMTGKTYGFLDTIGLHDSYYFATYIVDANFYSWNYHDGSRTRISGSTYYLASRLFDDPNIALIRDIQLHPDTGIRAEMEDVLFYDPTLSEGGSRENLDYYGKNIETVTMRSGWDSDAIFAGLHAGPNDVDHGDIDSGNFYLATGNIVWFGDAGAENYNVANFASQYKNDYFNSRCRYLYYRKSILPHNSVYLINSKLPRGQAFNSFSSVTGYAKIKDFYTDTLGAYGIADMTPQFNKVGDAQHSICTSAERGLLLTNSRSTVVIQDEMTFTGPTDVNWSATINESSKYAELSEDGRTAYIRNNTGEVMRVTLLCDNSDIKFKLVRDVNALYLTYNDKTDGLYTSTVNKGQIVTKANSGNDKASNPGTRLIVEARGVKSLNMAVVCEIIFDERQVVGYKMQQMSDWLPVSDSWVNSENQWIRDELNTSYKYLRSDLIRAMNRFDDAETVAERFEIVRDLYDIIHNIDLKKGDTAVLAKECERYISNFNIARGKTNERAEDFFFWSIAIIPPKEEGS